MNITTDQKSALNAVIKLSFKSEDYKDEVKKELNKHRKSAEVPGFRKGMVPMGMVRKMAGVQLVIEKLGELVRDALVAHIDENKINILGDPMPTDIKSEEDFDISCEKDMDFSFEIGIAPEFELNLDLKGLTEYEISTDDAYLEEIIDNMRDRFADYEYPEEVAAGDIVFAKAVERDVIETNEEGEEVEADGTMLVLNPKNLDLPKLFKYLKGKKKDEAYDFEMSLLGDKAAYMEAAYLDEESWVQMEGKKLTLIVKRITRTTLAELNEELFKKVLGPDAEETKDEAAFRAKLSEDIALQFKEAGQGRTRNKMHEALLENNQMEFPVDFMKRWMVETFKEVTEENAEEEFDKSRKGLQWSLITSKIAEDNPDKTKVEDEELSQQVQHEVARLMQSHGMDPNNQEEFKKYIQHFAQDKNFVNQQHAALMDQKIFALLEEDSKFKKKKMTATKFKKEAEAEKEAFDAEQKAAEEAK